jgi:hypothetical protein
VTVLVVAQSEDRGAEIDTLFRDVMTVFVIWPGKQLALEYDSILVVFDPMSAAEQRFVHHVIQRHLRPGGKVVYGMR